MRVVFILTKSPQNSGNTKICLKNALLARSQGYDIGIYLLGDAVFFAKNQQNIANDLKKLLASGCKLFVRKEDLVARGLKEDSLIPDVSVPSDFYDLLITDIMEKSERVICL